MINVVCGCQVQQNDHANALSGWTWKLCKEHERIMQGIQDETVTVLGRLVHVTTRRDD